MWLVYYGNLDEKCASIKLFWKTVEPFLSDKVVGKDRIHLTENNKIVKTDLKTEEIFIIFFNILLHKISIYRHMKRTMILL